jgi:hypothetical protein
MSVRVVPEAVTAVVVCFFTCAMVRSSRRSRRPGRGLVLAGNLDRGGGVHRTQPGCRVGSRDPLPDPAWGHRCDQRMQPTHRLGAQAGQVLVAVGEQPQHHSHGPPPAPCADAGRATPRPRSTTHRWDRSWTRALTPAAAPAPPTSPGHPPHPHRHGPAAEPVGTPGRRRTRSPTGAAGTARRTPTAPRPGPGPPSIDPGPFTLVVVDDHPWCGWPCAGQHRSPPSLPPTRRGNGGRGHS